MKKDELMVKGFTVIIWLIVISMIYLVYLKYRVILH
jgi:hypothetical protein